jgi:hypothetical protein
MATRAERLFDDIRSQGGSAISQLIARREQETLWLEFKTVATLPGSSALHPSDFKNLAKSVSGFGNAEGGVIVWGIDCPSDPRKSTKIVGVRNPRELMAMLENAVGACTVPPYGGVENLLVKVGGLEVVATYVSKSLLTPLRDLHADRYYVRVGDSFRPIPHDVLAGMFGRRPQPELGGRWNDLHTRVNSGSITSSAPFRLKNNGPGIARDLYVNLHIDFSIARAQSNVYGEPTVSPFNNWSRDELRDPGSSTGSWSFGSPDGVKLAPDFETAVFALQIEFSESFTGPLKFRLSFGHGQSPTTIIEVVRDNADFRRLYAETVQAGPRAQFLTRLLTP